MSLPSIAIFHMNDGNNKHSSCNVGWVFHEKNIPTTVKESASYANIKDTDWHSVTLYGTTYTKSDLNNITKRNTQNTT
jgi:hypothetical protein